MHSAFAAAPETLPRRPCWAYRPRSNPRRSLMLWSCALALAGGCDEACSSPPGPTGTPPAMALNERACGICYAHNWQAGGAGGYGSARSRASLDELSRLGIRQISITPFGWMDSPRSVTVKWLRHWATAESFQRLTTVVRRARVLGMRVTLKPHLWLRQGWRGELAPDSSAGGWDAFFRSYERFILTYAQLAQQLRTETFVVGVELKTATAARPGRWRSLIAAVRRAYSGRLTYAANWDEAERVSFWDALDAIGIQFFAPLATKPAPPDGEVLSAARRWLTRYEALAKRFDRPLRLTEVGFVNTVGGLMKPYIWPDAITHHPATAAGNREQALGYRAVLETFGRSPRVESISWWKWFSNPTSGEEGPTGYLPRGKPAAELLRGACRRAAAPRM